MFTKFFHFVVKQFQVGLKYLLIAFNTQVSIAFIQFVQEAGDKKRGFEPGFRDFLVKSIKVFLETVVFSLFNCQGLI